MKGKKDISEAVIKRLPRYYRLLQEMTETNETRVSSGSISERLGYSASQVRQDLSCFGEFGKQGLGYDVSYLMGEIEKIIGLTRTYQMILIGYGNIGRALAGYAGFRDNGFRIQAVFDVRIASDSDLQGIEFYDVSKLDRYISQRHPDIAVIAVPKTSAQAVADRVIGAGIRSIWNFAPIDLACGDGIKVENINMSESLYTLCYRMNH